MFLKLLLIFSALPCVLTHIVEVKHGEQECFYEDFKQAAVIKFMFEVIDGGSLDIDLTIYDPSGTVIHTENSKGSGKYKIEANQPGKHTYCFGNINSSQYRKLVLFNIENIDKPSLTSGDHAQLENMVTELSSLLTGVKHEMDFLAARDRLHFHISEKINSRIVAWSLFEFVLLVAVVLAQTFYTKRFFETRRAV